jgi:hypothetical protein
MITSQLAGPARVVSGLGRATAAGNSDRQYHDTVITESCSMTSYAVTDHDTSMTSYDSDGHDNTHSSSHLGTTVTVVLSLGTVVRRDQDSRCWQPEGLSLPG